MLCRRTLMSLVLLASMTASCRLFTPVNPSAPRTKPEPRPAAETGAKPEQQRVQRPAQQPAARAQGSGSLADANIAAMVLASNNTDISYARLVPSRAERADIKEFAKRMLTDHTAVNGLLNDLLTKLDLTPEDNVTSLDLRDESANKRDLMRELNGYAFDSTYIENEVAYHRKFLASLDNVMIPRARASELRVLLTTVRPAVAAHLAHAEQVRANVNSKK
jgi:putative membrane protein